MTDNFKLKSFEQMFKSTDPEALKKEKDIVLVPIDKLQPFKEHPFKSYSDEKMIEMVESIRQNGIFSPIIVRVLSDEVYEIIAGHNRVSASKIAGLDKVPAIIVNADDDTALIMMVSSNLNQRDSILPSERGKAYKLHLEALNRQGKRTDLTLCQNDTRIDSAKEIAEMNDVSRKQLFRFIRLTELLPELSELVDNEKLNFIFGVDLSYLPLPQQQQVFELLEDKEYKLTSANVAKMKGLAKEGSLTDETIKELMKIQKQPPKPNYHKQVDKTVKKYKLPKEKVATIIEKALAMYCNTEEFRKEMNLSG